MDKVDQLTSIISSVDKNTAVMANDMQHMVKTAIDTEKRLEQLEAKVSTYEKVAFWLHGATAMVSVGIGFVLNKFYAFITAPIGPIIK